MDGRLVALGGNALATDPSAHFEEQAGTVRETAATLAGLDTEGLVLTHGNGPQVGNRLLEQDRTGTPRLPMDVLVAETQAQVGYLLQRALDAELPGDFLTLVTQTVVDPADPAFDDPEKPVGPWYDREEATEKEFETAEVGTGEEPYRRVVPSPEPREVVESEEIAALVERGQGVVCGGGGGVPVVRTESGFGGVPAVVDKDHTSRLLADEIGVPELALVTDVDCAYRNWGDDPEPIGETTPAEMRDLLDSGAFGAGSMRPKVEAAVEFAESGGEAVVCSPDTLADALNGEAGTRIS
jgi:carbamate kinase